MEHFNDSPMIVRMVEADGFLRINRAFRERVGFTDLELAEKSLLDWIDPSDREVVRATLENGEGSCEAKHRMRDGDLLPLVIKVTNQAQGRFVLGRCAEAPLNGQLAEEVFDEGTVSGSLDAIARIIEEHVPDYKCSILLVADGRFVSGAGPSLPTEYNAAVDGYAIGPAVGSCGTAIYWNVPVVVEDIQADPLWVDLAPLAKKAGVAACWSHPFTSSNGKVLGALALYAPEPRAPTSEQLSLLRAAARMTGLAVERGRAEEALREQRKRELELENQLRQAAKMEALGVLAGGIAHDFNNVLATILANAELALEISPDDGEVNPMLHEIVEASQRAGSFCKQMLAYSGGGSVATSRFELGGLIPQLSSLVKAALSKKATLEYSLHDGPIFLEGDENQLLQVIMNLVINAGDALGDGEGRIEVRTELANHDVVTLRDVAPGQDLPAGEYACLKVIDTGCGIDPSEFDRIFDPFFTTKANGRGLGLAAVQGIVHSHGGVVLIESELGKGTTFTVLLPTVVATAVQSPEPETVPDTALQKRVLVVDDDDSLRFIMCRWLKHSGFDVLEAADGQEGIDVFRQNPDSIDCVLLDLSMPKLSGDEAHREIKALKGDTPIILLSGYAEQEILDRFAGTQVTGILQKPVPAAEIVAAVRGAVT